MRVLRSLALVLVVLLGASVAMPAQAQDVAPADPGSGATGSDDPGSGDPDADAAGGEDADAPSADDGTAAVRAGAGEPAVAGEEAPLPEGHRPEVVLAIEPREGLATGDLVHVVITVRLPEGDDVAVPRQSFGPFELHSQRHRDRPIDGGRRELVFEIDLLALEPGEHELPALRLRVVTADGTVGTVRTEPQRIVVESLIANEPDAQPRPPTQPVAVMQDDYTLAWVLGILAIVLLTALVTWLVARWWSRRPKKAAPPPPPRPAWEVATAKLEDLRRRSRDLLVEGKHVELVDGVSDALREYFGARYDFNGLESTTDEVLSRLRRVHLQGATVQEVAALLGDCDLVKFAKAQPSDEQCDQMIAGALRLVRATMPGHAVVVGPGQGPGSGQGPGPGQGAAQGPGQGPGPGTGYGVVPGPDVLPDASSGSAPAPAGFPTTLSGSAPGSTSASVSPVSASPSVPASPSASAPAPVAASDSASAQVADSAAVADSAQASASVAVSASAQGPASVAASASGPSPASGAPIILPLAVSSPSTLGPVLTASVLGAVESRALDPDFDGTVVVSLGPSLADEYEARQALRAVHAELAATLASRRSASGAPLRLVIEHLHESARDAALEGREPRKTVYAPPGPAATLMGNAFARDPDEDPR